MYSLRAIIVVGILGLLMAAGGSATAVLYLFQPWRTCDYDDTAAACAMLPGDAAGLGIAVVVSIIGVCTVGVALLARRDIRNRARAI